MKLGNMLSNLLYANVPTAFVGAVGIGSDVAVDQVIETGDPWGVVVKIVILFATLWKMYQEKKQKNGSSGS